MACFQANVLLEVLVIKYSLGGGRLVFLELKC